MKNNKKDELWNKLINIIYDFNKENDNKLHLEFFQKNRCVHITIGR